MTTTTIEWAEQVWNPIVGCTVHSAGCTNCYAMRMAARLEAMASRPDGSGNFALDHYHGTTEVARNGNPVWTGKLGFSETALLAPLKRTKPTRYFVNSMSDLFHESVPDDWIDRVFAVMALCPQHTFQVLTKRSGRMREYLSGVWGDHDAEIARTTAAVNDVFRLAGHRGSWGWCGSTSTSITTIGRGTGAREYAMLRRLPDGGVKRFYWHDGKETWTRCSDVYAARVPVWGAHDSEFGWGLKQWPLPNVWLGVSVEDQRAADERIPDLLATPAAVRWISAEPLLGPVDLTYLDHDSTSIFDAINGRHGVMIPLGGENAKLDWIVCGGESGPGARPMHPDWARSLRDQCQAAGVPFFFKQWGEWAHAAPRPSETPGRFAMMAREPIGWAHTHAVEIDAYPRQFSQLGSVVLERIGKKQAGRLLDGREWSEYPA